MASHSGDIRASGQFVAWPGRLVMALVAGKDLRVRQVIARAAADAGHGLDLKTRRHAGLDRAADPRVE
jgi:hypothetical protein